MTLFCKPYNAAYEFVFKQLIQDSPSWQKEECSISELHTYMQKYEMMNGQWDVWFKNEQPIGITFTVDWAPSNEKPWIGTILVDGQARRQGSGKNIVEAIADSYKKEGNDALFTAVPLERTKWMQFFAACGFEQFKVEENEQNALYMMMVRPLS